MTQTEKRAYLIQYLQKESKPCSFVNIPKGEQEQKMLLRSLLNVRMPKEVEQEFLEIQDSYLQEEIAKKGIVELAELLPIQHGIYLWQGDITRLRCDAIVNAANAQMLGCFCPCHGCIDNQIHTFSGVQLRLSCARQMIEQGREEETGMAKITPAYNLPCRYILHTVGPIVKGRVTTEAQEQLSSCYRSCLALTEQKKLKNIAFCCISTGEYHFPQKRAAKIAIQTVKDYQKETKNKIEVIFNVYKSEDYDIYRSLLEEDGMVKSRIENCGCNPDWRRRRNVGSSGVDL